MCKTKYILNTKYTKCISFELRKNKLFVLVIILAYMHMKTHRKMSNSQTCVHGHIHTWTHARSGMHACMLTYIYTYMRTRVHAYAHTGVHAYTHNEYTPVHTNKRTYVHTCTPTRTHTYKHMHAYMHAWLGRTH